MKLRMIIHDWPDVEATTILQNIRKVMGPNSRVFIRESTLVPYCVTTSQCLALDESVLFHTVQEPGVQIDGLSIVSL
jgi:hypothetical protein